MKEKTCAFTGHRPQRLPFGFDESDPRCINLKMRLRDEIIRQIEEKSVFRFLSGMAIGVDQYAAEIVCELKGQYPHIELECVIPCENQAVKWSFKARERYFNLVARCDKETMIQRQYTPDCMQKRNIYMADNAKKLIAVWDGHSSGTANTVKYAQSIGMDIILINPKEI